MVKKQLLIEVSENRFGGFNATRFIAGKPHGATWGKTPKIAKKRLLNAIKKGY